MMEGSHDDGSYLVRVRAQVMTRDDSTGGWVPLGGGGLSHVSVCKSSVASEEDKLEYLIYGKRIADQSIILSCTIKKDFQYNKVMPTFHHWRTGDKKYGLTFQTAADARAFDKGVRMAIEDLSDGIGDFPNFHDSDLGDDDVFMTLELPADSRSSSASSSSFGGGPFRPAGSGSHLDPGIFTHPHANHHHLHHMNFIRSPRFPAGVNPSSNNNIVPDPTMRGTPNKDFFALDAMEVGGDLNSYVQLSREKGCRTENDYSYPSYPVLDSHKRDAPKKPGHLPCQPAPRLPVKAKRDSRWRKDRRTLTLGRLQCRHCLEIYSPSNNRPGSCDYAPDSFLKCIDGVSCMFCARCMLYHCMGDDDSGDFDAHPCSCDSSVSRCPSRWSALALLSIFVPCLCCLPFLRSCHRCGVKCAICGGRHESA